MKEEEYDAQKRADELHSKLNRATQDKTTTAVGKTEENIGIVGSSEGRLRKTVKRALHDFEIEAKGEPGKHAEEYIVDEAEKQSLSLKEIAASRAICLDCEELLDEKGITSPTPKSGKKSRKRK